MTQQSIPAALFRGGTSKGVYVRTDALPANRAARERLLLRTFGSPDPMQVDGVGGSHSTASKAMLVSAADDPAVDVQYRFAQVGIEKPVVDWGGNCGNLTFAVGPYAIERGLVSPPADANRADLVLENANTGTVVEQSVPLTDDGSPRYRGEFRVHGVPGTGARIRSRFLDPGGSVTGAVFPTGTRVDTLDVAGVGRVETSLVDVSNPCAFVRASDVGLDPTALPAEIDGDAALVERLERIRSAACARLGFVDGAADATAESPGIPKMAVVGERDAYETSTGDRVEAGDYDLLARIMSMQKAHHAYAVTGAMCTATAAALEGTIPNEYLASDAAPEGTAAAPDGDDAPDPDGGAETSRRITIGHPKGTMTVGVGIEDETVEHSTLDRTARQLMRGDLYYLDDGGPADERTEDGSP